MSELEDTADHLIVIGKGRLLADVSVNELIASASGERVEIRTPDAQAAMTLLASTGVTAVSSGRDQVTVHGMAAHRVAELLVSRQIRLEELRSSKATLEEAYFWLTRDAASHTAVPIGAEKVRRMTRTLHSEWTKLKTQRGTLVALLMTAVLMVGFSAFFASEQETNAVFGGDDDLVQMGLMGIAFAQIAVVVVGASLITAEFATGMIRTTLTATQGRLRLLLAKAIVLCVVVFPIALVASVLGFVAAQSLLRGNGYEPPAYPGSR